MTRLSRFAAIFSAVVLLFGLGLLGYIVVPYFTGESAAERAAFLHTVSEQMNSELPEQVDDSTRLDSTSVDGDTLAFNFTLLPPLAETLDRETFAPRYADGIRQTICSKQRLRRMLAEGYRIAYRYTLTDGSALGSVEAGADDCRSSG